MALKHAFSSSIADGGDATLVRPSNWNAEHVIDAWDDLQGSVQQGTVAAALTSEAYRDTPFIMDFMRHDQDDKLYFTFQMPHDWNESTAVHFHVHCVPMVNPATPQVVYFTGSYAWGPLYLGELPANASWTGFSSSMTVSTSGAFLHHYHEITQMAPPANTSGSSMLCVYVCRTGTSALDTYTTAKSGGTTAANLGVLYFDMHYQKNKIGSVNEAP